MRRYNVEVHSDFVHAEENLLLLFIIAPYYFHSSLRIPNRFECNNGLKGRKRFVYGNRFPRKKFNSNLKLCFCYNLNILKLTIIIIFHVFCNRLKQKSIENKEFMQRKPLYEWVHEILHLEPLNQWAMGIHHINYFEWVLRRIQQFY